MNREQLFREAIRENSQRIFRICCYFFDDQDDRNDAYQESLILIRSCLFRYFQSSERKVTMLRLSLFSFARPKNGTVS